MTVAPSAMSSAVRQALRLQRQKELGVGVTCESPAALSHLQWFREEDGGIQHLEIRPGDKDDPAVAALHDQGFTPHFRVELAELGWLLYHGDHPFAGARSDAEVEQALVRVIQLLQLPDDTEFLAYP